MVKNANVQGVIAWRRRIKEALTLAMGGECAACGLETHQAVYDFHHMDPNQKDLNISGSTRSFASLTKEASKCILLCANCHRLHHAGELEVSHLYKGNYDFDEALHKVKVIHGVWGTSCLVCTDLAAPPNFLFCSRSCKGKVDRARQLLAGRVEDDYKFCIDCGAKVSRSLGRCDSCARAARPRKIDWPDCQELLDKLTESNYSKLGRELGVSDNAIRKHMKRNCECN